MPLRVASSSLSRLMELHVSSWPGTLHGRRRRGGKKLENAVEAGTSVEGPGVATGVFDRYRPRLLPSRAKAVLPCHCFLDCSCSFECHPRMKIEWTSPISYSQRFDGFLREFCADKLLGDTNTLVSISGLSHRLVVIRDTDDQP